MRFETVTVDDLLVSTSGASLRLLILDACRNNPLARSMQRTAAFRSVSGGSFADLNEGLLGDETLVAYAAAAGTTAADGRGRNSPYTAALLSHLETPLEIDVTELPIAALHELAEVGDAEAQTELGERYLYGRGMEPDHGVAVYWFRRAAEQAYAPGQAFLGAMYVGGHGVQPDLSAGIRWYRRAAEQGDPAGQAELGSSVNSMLRTRRLRGVRPDGAWSAPAEILNRKGGSDNVVIG